MVTGYHSYFIEEEAEAQRGWPTCPGLHTSVTPEHEGGTMLRGGWGDQALKGVGSWAEELGLDLHTYLLPFLIKSWALEAE